MKELHKGHAYRLVGMTPDMWQVPHPRWGAPISIVGVFIACVEATRNWYCFEIRVAGKEQGMIFLPEEDLIKLHLRDLGVYLNKGDTNDPNRSRRR